MPIISTIGRRSLKIRAIVLAIYLLLGIGAASMIYPLLLMLSGSVKSATDFPWVTPFPEYLLSDEVLWMKYHESKYLFVPSLQAAQHQSTTDFRHIRPPRHDEIDTERVRDFIAFREQVPWPTHWFRIGHMMRLRPRYREAVRRRFGTLEDFSRAAGVRFASWTQVGPPIPAYEFRHFTHPTQATYQIYYDLQEDWPLRDREVINLDGVFWNYFLRPKWFTIEQYNAAHGTDYRDYTEVLLPRRAPENELQRRDWEQFVRQDLNLAFIRIDTAVTPAFQTYLREQYAGDLDELNRLWGTSHAHFSDIPLPRGSPASLRAQADLSQFLRDADRCPLQAVRIDGPRQAFEEFLAARHGVSVEDVTPARMPVIAADWFDFQQQTGELRRQFLASNYQIVLNHLFLHGHGVRNTLIYCAMLIAVTLTINPLAAYALSRYRPASTYKILLFCMATMAFPAEVTMIPSFLLLKRFPLLALAGGAGSGLIAAWWIAKTWPRLAEWVRGVLGGGVGIVVGFWLMPLVLGVESTSISLLNTFWALVLPAAANGFSIFLLKGFFDSLPQELYEAAEIDGANEWTKFWVITMSLSKPILAVLGLSAFTAAYSEFMMALVIIPDQRMWTIMVWLFQLQSQVPPHTLYASIVVAAIPTFLVFLFAQSLIMRGIVVPTEK